MTSNCIREAGHHLPAHYVQDALVSKRQDKGVLVATSWKSPNVLAQKRLYFLRNTDGAIQQIYAGQFEQCVHSCLIGV